MKLIGIDPGFASIGFAVMHVPTKDRACVLEMGIIETEASAKKNRIVSTEDNLRRAKEIARALRTLLARHVSASAFCAEAMSFPRSASVAAKMAMCWGVLAALSEATSVPILQSSPQHVKRVACGKISATKEEIQDRMLELYPEIAPMREKLLTPKGTTNDWEHPHDALACAHAMLGSEAVEIARRAA